MAKRKTRQEKLADFDRACREMIEARVADALKYKGRSARFYIERMTGELLGIQRAMYALAAPGAEKEALQAIFDLHFDEHWRVIDRVRAELQAKPVNPSPLAETLV